MQQDNIKDKEIAIRFYESAKYGSTYAKGLRHAAVFNAAADIRSPNAKYLLDFYTYAHWQHTARSDVDMQVSWVVKQDPITKAKQRVPGFCTFDMGTRTCKLIVDDAGTGVQQVWKLTAKQCKRVAGKNVPTLLATNADLGDW